MKSPRDRLFLTPHWHVDCRLVAELPEDSVVGVRFITYAVSCLITLSVALFTGWYVYTDLNLRHTIDDGELHLEDNRWDVIEIIRLQHFYEIESKKIESAYNEMQNPVLFSGFILELGKTLPERMVIDSIDYSEGTFGVRGRLRETSEQASIVLGDYLATLRKDAEVGPRFALIKVTALDRSLNDEQVMNYAITFKVNPRRP